MPLAAPLFALRSLPARIARRPGLPSRMDEPLLAQMLDAGFAVLGERPGEEIVVGLIGQLWRPSGRIVPVTGREPFAAFQEPGFVKAALSFAVWADGEQTFALTETRVVATDPAAERAFRRYWLLVGPFSGLLRRTWLLGVARRAGRAAGDPAM